MREAGALSKRWIPHDLSAGGKRVYTTTVAPLLSRSVARPRGHRAEKAMVYTVFLGKQGKRVYTIGPERRVYIRWIQEGFKGGFCRST